MTFGLVVLAWRERWTQDDAYITYRYSEHLSMGLGPVWNAGQVVEGYTNFLWMLCLAGSHALGLPIVESSFVLSILCFVGTLWVTDSLARSFLPRTESLLATALVGTNYSLFMYATGGLETQLYALLTVGLLLQTRRGLESRAWPIGRLVGISVMMAAVVMTRPDGTLVAAIAGISALLGIASAPDRTARLRRVVAVSLPCATLVLPWLFWKVSFYGDLIPNTAHAKLGGSSSLVALRGLAYVGLFFLSYGLAFVIAYLGLKQVLAGTRIRIGIGDRPLLIYLVLWCLYVIRAGGDVMEFRMMVPAIPVLYVLLIRAVAAQGRRTLIAVALILCAANLVHARFFPSYARPKGVGNVRQLEAWVGNEPTSWAEMGRRIGEATRYDRELTIALTPAGAIPFYSKARTIDMLGLNDAWVARNGFRRERCGVCYAHARLATIEYLRRSGTHLVLGFPSLVDKTIPSDGDPHAAFQTVRRMFWEESLDFDRLPEDARLLRIPLDEQLALAAIYLERHPRIEALVASGEWSTEPLRVPAEHR